MTPLTTFLGGPLTGAGSSLICVALSALLSLEMLIRLLKPIRDGSDRLRDDRPTATPVSTSLG